MTRKRFVEFAAGGISLRFLTQVELSTGRYGAGQLYEPDMELTCRDGAYTGTCMLGDVRLMFEARMSPGNDGMDIHLTARNEGGMPVYIRRLTPFFADGGDIRIGENDSREWLIYRQGRHKNDLPGVCCPGNDDECFADVMTSLAETGMGGDTDATAIVSDSVTLLCGGKGSAENLLIAFPRGDMHLVKTEITLDARRMIHTVRASSELNIRLDPGCEAAAEPVTLRRETEPTAALDRFAAEKARLFGARVSREIPSVYCTWYYYGLTVTERDVRENLSILAERHIPFTVFQIDEGWERVLGDWRPNEKFPSGMEALAALIAGAGYIPGIWTSPFIAHATSPVVQEHPEWFLYHEDGTPCLFPMNDTVYLVMDITNPAPVEWVRGIYRMLRGMGYRYHKLDFTRAAVIQEKCAYFDETVSVVTAFRSAMQVIREAIGEGSYLLICGGLYDPLIGIADAQRSGSDVLSIWSQQSLQQKGGKVAPFTMKQSLMRYYMNRWWHNDPDALMVRRQQERTLDLNLTLGLLTDTEAITSTLNQYIGGGIVCSTEPMARIEDDRLMLLRHILPVLPARVTPRDLFSGKRYPACVDVEVSGGAWHTLCLINWADSEPMPARICISEAILGAFAKEHARFIAADMSGDHIAEGLLPGDIFDAGMIEPHGCRVIKVMPMDSLPQVVASDAHFSMGAEADIPVLDEQGVLHFGCEMIFDAPARYDILLPEGIEAADGAGRRVSVVISGRGRQLIEIPTRRVD